ncbi:hypothetical protein [Streptacidiphilus melanogenes]|uniref:hypothetical protein n=1 Tax=Streptacidiphilus melanogenes TaxID=411235 RepID=UPI0005A995A9|nr:hypothetical protein [Streptacidiphilus melanogenes]
MRTLMRRAVTTAATFTLAGAALAGAVAPASASANGAVPWSSISTWHCKATLWAHHSGTWFGASYTLNSYTAYQSHISEYTCVGFLKFSNDGGRHWSSAEAVNYLYGPHKHTASGTYNDSSLVSKACVEEWYQWWTPSSGWQGYDSDQRCTPAW